MTNEKIWEELQRVGQLMKKYENEGNLYKRNELVPIWCELHDKYDFGFEVGDQVIAPIVRKNKIFIITKKLPENRFELDGDINCDGIFIKKYNPEPE